jgi:hypothetical protein
LFNMVVNLCAGSKGLGFIALNVVRAINMIVLATIAVSSAVLMVVAKMPNGFTFFSDVSLTFLITVCFFLGLSEIGIWQNWFARHWPAFGPERGLTWLGFSMLMMGSHTLGKLSDDRYSTDKMGNIFWNVCLAAGILAIIFGFVNVFMSWWFGRRQGLSVRKLRSDGKMEPIEPFPDDTNASSRSNSVPQEKTKSMLPWRKSKKPQISHPISDTTCYDEEKGAPLEDRGSPIAPGIQRPLTNLHPMYNHLGPSTDRIYTSHEIPPPVHHANHRPTPSQYSVATDYPI